MGSRFERFREPVEPFGERLTVDVHDDAREVGAVRVLRAEDDGRPEGIELGGPLRTVSAHDHRASVAGAGRERLGAPLRSGP